MNRIKKTATAVKGHFTKHAFAYVTTSIAVASAMVWVETSRAKQVEQFLTSKGLDYEEFVNPEYYNEIEEGGEAA